MKSSATATAKKDLLRFLPSWKLLQFIAVGVTLLVLAFVLALYVNHTHQQRRLDELLIDADRDYRLLPFDMLDAERYCKLRLERRYGDDLEQSYVDQHSSRLDPSTGFYKIFMFAYIGSGKEQEREAVHCVVDPERRVLTHFRTIGLQKSSLMSRATKFFK